MSTQIDNLLFNLSTPGVQGLTPYEPGKPVEELQRELGVTEVIKLASNENPLGMSSKAKQAIQETIKDAHLYPDGNAFYLKQALAKKHGVETSQVTIGNGSNDILEIIARSFADSSSAIMYSQYAFAVYPIVTQALGAKHVMVPAKDWGHDLSAMLNAITSKTKIIFIANPNNPTGTCFPKTELESFLSQVPQNVIVVLDEAYHDYIQIPDYVSAEKYLDKHPNLIVSRTFSKAYGLAGLRVGYSLSHPDVANVLNRVRQPFNANIFALAAAEAALEDDGFIRESVTINTQGMQQLESAFSRLGLSYIPSAGNFIAVDVKRNGGEIYNSLLNKGVIVRPVGPYKMPTHIRVSIGLPEQNERFLSALESVLKAS